MTRLIAMILAILAIAACTGNPPRPDEPSSIALRNERQEARIRAVRIGLLALKIDGKISAEEYAKAHAAAVALTNCIRQDPTCALDDFTRLDDPAKRMELINRLLDRLEADLAQKG